MNILFPPKSSMSHSRVWLLLFQLCLYGPLRASHILSCLLRGRLVTMLKWSIKLKLITDGQVQLVSTLDDVITLVTVINSSFLYYRPRDHSRTVVLHLSKYSFSVLQRFPVACLAWTCFPLPSRLAKVEIDQHLFALVWGWFHIPSPLQSGKRHPLFTHSPPSDVNAKEELLSLFNSHRKKIHRNYFPNKPLFYKKVNIIKKVFSAMPIWTCGVDWKKVNSVTQAQAHTDRMESTCTLIRIKWCDGLLDRIHTSLSLAFAFFSSPYDIRAWLSTSLSLNLK